MDIGSMCRRRLITVQRGDELKEAARLMREHHVGFLVVVDSVDRQGQGRVVGVLTDRDIVVSVIARDIDARTLKVGDVLTSGPATVREHDPLEFALAEMRRLGVRRLPVLNDCGTLAGVVSLDDIVPQLVRQLNDVAGSIHTEGLVERESRAAL
jgi:CBS domain-containing protein